jgi:hypothetical protein
MIFGDSHTVAIAQAIAYRETNPDPVLPRMELFRLRKTKGDVELGDTDVEEFCRMISGLNPSDAVFSAIGGNQYAVASTVRTQPYFDVVTTKAAAQTREPDVTLIPARVMESYIASGVVSSDGPMIKRIRMATRARVFHLTPPPPKEDNAFIKRFHEARFAAEGLGSLEPHSPLLRLTCWEMQRKSLASFCNEIGVELLPPPSVTVGERGFLDQHYFGKDVTHANRRYGEQVLRQIAAAAEATEETVR